MAQTAKRDKDENFWKILNAALELDVKKGHLKWTLSDLSRKSKITRSLIYYYFGRSKASILQEAIKLIGEELVGMSKERLEMWSKGDLQTSMAASRKLRENAPYICQFCLEHRDLQNDIGESIRSIEEEFRQKIRTFFPQISEAEVEGIYTVYWGLTFVPEISPEAMQAVVQLIQVKKASVSVKASIASQK
tara:strand:- start:12351 stop:12923 length:573 start_codon:yes stop_codon:yes gene_type:complete